MYWKSHSQVRSSPVRTRTRYAIFLTKGDSCNVHNRKTFHGNFFVWHMLKKNSLFVLSWVTIVHTVHICCFQHHFCIDCITSNNILLTSVALLCFHENCKSTIEWKFCKHKRECYDSQNQLEFFHLKIDSNYIHRDRRGGCLQMIIRPNKSLSAPLSQPSNVIEFCSLCSTQDICSAWVHLGFYCKDDIWVVVRLFAEPLSTFWDDQLT